MEKVDTRSYSLPYRQVRLGGRVLIGGREYGVVLRPGGLVPREACRGCAFRSGTCPPSYACSGFDREDGKFIWFVGYEGIEER